MKVWVERARRPEVLGGIGGFAGLFDASALKRYERPLLATSADGVGTKVAIAQAMDVHHTIGFDLVGMLDRKSTRLNSSHANISYAVFCLKKKKQQPHYSCC